VRVAVPECRGRVAPVFDSCQRVVMFDVVEGRSEAVGAVDLRQFTTAMRVGLLRAYGVSTLLCGAISTVAERALLATGVEVQGFICGDVARIVQAYTDGSFSHATYAMPGCRR